jgi:diaminopimelate decarboxylase
LNREAQVIGTTELARASLVDAAPTTNDLAGPACDSTGIIYQRAGDELPVGLTAGDFVDCLSAGAYTASYVSVAFNGFVLARTYRI